MIQQKAAPGHPLERRRYPGTPVPGRRGPGPRPNGPASSAVLNSTGWTENRTRNSPTPLNPKKAAWAGVDTWGITSGVKDSEKLELCHKWIDFRLKKENMVIVAKEIGWAPTVDVARHAAAAVHRHPVPGSDVVHQGPVPVRRSVFARKVGAGLVRSGSRLTSLSLNSDRSGGVRRNGPPTTTRLTLDRYYD